jgi:hypothetical protein
MIQDIDTNENREVILGKQVIDQFAHTINNMGFSQNLFGEALATQFVREHRTLQQDMLRTLSYFFQHLAKYHNEHPDRTDLRNEGGIAWVKEVAKVEPNYFPIV